MRPLEFLCDRRFHQTFFLPPNPQTSRPKRFRVSYADYGDSTSDAVVLICGALMATRFCYAPLDELAKTRRVRIIHPDRPGIGGTDPVKQDERITMWLEMVPQLLAHLKVGYISIASHSGGDVYAISTMLAFPYLLHPKTPYVMFFAPWVHPDHSGIRSMKAAERLPTAFIVQFSTMVRFVHEVMPKAGLHCHICHELKDIFHYYIAHHSNHATAPIPLKHAPSPLERSRTSLNSRTSILSPLTSKSSVCWPPGPDLDDPQVVEEMRQLIVTWLFAESMDGISADAQLFLKKGKDTRWCSPTLFWSGIDHAAFLVANIDKYRGDNKSGRYWVVDSFHAEDDRLVGEKGRRWFDACWEAALSLGANGNEQAESKFMYRTEVIPGTDHR